MDAQGVIIIIVFIIVCLAILRYDDYTPDDN